MPCSSVHIQSAHGRCWLVGFTDCFVSHQHQVKEVVPPSCLSLHRYGSGDLLAPLQTGLHWQWNDKKWPHAPLCFQGPNCTQSVQIQERCQEERANQWWDFPTVWGEEKEAGPHSSHPKPGCPLGQYRTLASHVWQKGEMQGSWLPRNTQSHVQKVQHTPLLHSRQELFFKVPHWIKSDHMENLTWHNAYMKWWYMKPTAVSNEICEYVSVGFFAFCLVICWHF